MPPRSTTLLCVVAAAAAGLVQGAERLSSTHYECHFGGAWMDACRYTNICFGSGPTDLVFIDDDAAKHDIKRGSQPIWASTKLHRQPPGIPDPDRDSPIHYKRTQRTRTVSKQWVSENSEQLVWFDKTLYIPSYFENLGNIWFYSSRVLPLFATQVYRREWELPKMEDILLLGPEHKIKADWHTNILDLAKDKDAKVYFKSDEKYEGLHRSDGRLTCFRKAVLLGATMYGFMDMVTAFEFRRRAYDKFGLSYKVPDQPPRMVTILDRGLSRARHFLNIKEMNAIIEKYDVPYNRVIIQDDDTFEKQLDIMSKTGVLVTMHGAGLMNEIIMPPGSAIIEIFPVHLKHVLYERVAHYAGVYHFKVYARDFGDGFHIKHPDYFKYDCDNSTSLKIPDHGMCWLTIKNANIVTPLPEFEVALAHALDHISVRTKLHNPESYDMDALEDRSLVKH